MGMELRIYSRPVLQELITSGRLTRRDVTPRQCANSWRKTTSLKRWKTKESDQVGHQSPLGSGPIGQQKPGIGHHETGPSSENARSRRDRETRRCRREGEGRGSRKEETEEVKPENN